MTVAMILSSKGHNVTSVGVGDSLTKAVGELTARKIGAVVVCDGNQRVLGILSERDIVRALAAFGAAALDNPVEQHMTTKVITCGEAATVDECMSAMTDGRFRHMPVVENEKLVGIISIGDIVKVKIAAAVEEAEAMRNYIAAG
ncbi:CBS domain protein [hydrothermal vent metagenome]|uniref:CBS domain protein n=1 Tax=hydrothermal vent metagenome TaxID=652676 RepID=A0A3B0T826_9ZZZZ